MAIMQQGRDTPDHANDVQDEMDIYSSTVHHLQTVSSLDAIHQEKILNTVRNVLCTTLAETTLAQLVDGLTVGSRLETRIHLFGDTTQRACQHYSSTSGIPTTISIPMVLRTALYLCMMSQSPRGKLLYGI
jgi:hypothetical protein